jgi:hypothetical protein
MGCLLFFLARLGRLDWLQLQPSHSREEAKRSTLHRLLKPRCPDDCPACRRASTASWGRELASTPVRPWREVKSRGERAIRVNTAGYACPNQKCLYFGITDALIHALVGDGKHGRAERIQTFRGLACHTTFSARHNTPLYRLKTPSHQVAMVLAARACGLDPSAASRVFGFRQATITSLSDSRWESCTDLARTLLLPSAPPASAVRRASYPAALLHTGAVALAGYRSLHQDASRALVFVRAHNTWPIR